MRILVTSDWHLTTNPLDEYRWKFVEGLAEFCKEENIDKIYFLGDLTEKTNNHSAVLVNRIIDCLQKLPPMILLKGNHDYVDPKTPFFRFISLYKDKLIYNKQTILDNNLFIPHGVSLDEVSLYDLSYFNYIFVHEDFKGSTYENGVPSPSKKDISLFNSALVFSGHIHKPQQIGNLTYVGSPYPIKFCDEDWQYRMYILDSDTVETIYNDYPYRLNFRVSDIEEFKLKIETMKLQPSDQMKVIFQIKESDAYLVDRWKSEVKIVCDAHEIILCGISTELIDSEDKYTNITSKIKRKKDYLDGYIKREQVGEKSSTIARQLVEKLKRQ